MVSARRLARRQAKAAAKAAGLPPPKFQRGQPIPTPAEILAKAGKTGVALPPVRTRNRGPKLAVGSASDVDDLLGLTPSAKPASGPKTDPEEAFNDTDEVGVWSSKGPPYHIVLVTKWGRKLVHYVPIEEPLGLKDMPVADFARGYVKKQPGRVQRTPEQAACYVLKQGHTGTKEAMRSLEQLAGYDIL